MFGPKELDLRNVYNPNLQNISESAKRTYGEANSFYRKEELYLKDVERRIFSEELIDEKEIYDECHAIASDLAKCCEMYLKAIYIFEHNIPGNKIDELWDGLKNSEFMIDERGNLLYKTSNGEVTFAKYDLYGNPNKDSAGKVIYYDKNGNVYNDNNKGSKIKRNGHQLDRLIDLLSPESSLLLETRMLTIPMEKTENNSSISIFDVLLEKGILSLDNQISSEQYISWIDQYKKTFEEARYSGQKRYDVNVEFLYHLATQIKAVAQYKMAPKHSQHFTITQEELNSLPEEIKQLALFRSDLLSEELIKIIANDDEIKNKIKVLFSGNYVLPPKNISPKDFYSMINLMSSNEIIYSFYLCYMIQNSNKLNKGEMSEDTGEDVKQTLKIALIFKSIDLKPEQVIGLFIQIKSIFKNKVTIGNESIGKLLQTLQNKDVYGYYYLANENKKYINRYYNKDIDINMKNNFKNKF